MFKEIDNELYYDEDACRELRACYYKDKRKFLKKLLEELFSLNTDKYKLCRVSLNAIDYFTKYKVYTRLVKIEDTRKWNNPSELITGEIEYLKVAKELYDLVGKKESVLLANKPKKVRIKFLLNKIGALDSPAYLEIS